MTEGFKTMSGNGGETHQQQTGETPVLTTNHSVAVSDNQNGLKSGAREPTLVEDIVLREKIFHFGHERIPEPIVHARASDAAQSLLVKAGVVPDEGVIGIDTAFVTTAAQRYYDREPKLRTLA